MLEFGFTGSMVDLCLVTLVLTIRWRGCCTVPRVRVTGLPSGGRSRCHDRDDELADHRSFVGSSNQGTSSSDVSIRTTQQRARLSTVVGSSGSLVS